MIRTLVSLNKLLQNHSWKGNIRELKNIMERAVIVENSEFITEGSLPFDMLNTSMHETDTAFDLSTIEKSHIQKVLRYTKGNKTETARLLNIGLTTLYRKIKEYGLK